MVEVGSTALRAQVVDKTVTGFAERAYKFKQACTIAPTSAWKNVFYRETATPLTGGTGSSISAIPRGANFPQAVVTWTKVDALIEKYGLEDNIQWEDILTDDLDVQARTLFRISEGVAKAVDDAIWDDLTESRSVVNINSVTIAATKHWSGTSAAIIDNLMNAKQLIAENNYDTSNLMLFVSPKDHRSLVRWLHDKGTQAPLIGNDVGTNGRVGTIAGMTIVQSNSVTASYALLVVPKVCATWREVVPLSTTTVEDPYKSVKIRAVEMGVTELKNPKAVCLISNTQGTGAE